MFIVFLNKILCVMIFIKIKIKIGVQVVNNVLQIKIIKTIINKYKMELMPVIKTF